MSSTIFLLAAIFVPISMAPPVEQSVVTPVDVLPFLQAVYKQYEELLKSRQTVERAMLETLQYALQYPKPVMSEWATLERFCAQARRERRDETLKEALAPHGLVEYFKEQIMAEKTALHSCNLLIPERQLSQYDIDYCLELLTLAGKKTVEMKAAESKSSTVEAIESKQTTSLMGYAIQKGYGRMVFDWRLVVSSCQEAYAEHSVAKDGTSATEVKGATHPAQCEVHPDLANAETDGVCKVLACQTLRIPKLAVASHAGQKEAP